MVAPRGPRFARVRGRSVDAKEMQGVPDKFEKFLSPNPGMGS
jgi:hypothetical protein